MKYVGVIILLVVVVLYGTSAVFWDNETDYDVSDFSNTEPTTIRIERDTLHLGTVGYGEKRSASFRILNTGTEPLLIYRVAAACGCTDVKWSKKPVKPGEATDIHVVFEPNSLGRFMKSIDVQCNTATRIYKLQLRGEVVE